jgi:hypothetical protein
MLRLRCLFRRAPHLREKATLLSQPVQRVVRLAHCPNKPAKREVGVLSWNGAAVVVDVGDGDLDGTMVIGADQAVGCAALARDIAVRYQ